MNGRFLAGHKPWNKGKKTGILPTNAFQKGNVPITDRHHSKRMAGKRGLNWKGGKIIQKNRLFIYKPDHPFCDSKGYIRNARLVVEKYLGRFLEKSEVIHHINENKLDDRPENLYLFENQSAHCKFHWKIKKNETSLESLSSNIINL